MTWRSHGITWHHNGGRNFKTISITIGQALVSGASTIALSRCEGFFTHVQDTLRFVSMFQVIAVEHEPAFRAVLLFSKLNVIYSGYFDPEKILLDNENK